MRYRKKPVEVLAWDIGSLLTAFNQAGAEALPNSVLSGWKKGELEFATDHVLIVTLEGAVVGRDGDMLICGVKGEFYPCRNDIFDQTYERA